MTEREALQDLLEVVDAAISSGDWKVDGACDPDAAIQRARQALAQPEHGWTSERITGMSRLKEAQDKKLAQPELWEKFCDSNCSWTDHHPDCKLAEQKPVAFVKGCNRGQWEIFPAKAYQIFEREQPLYANPSQRTWIGLTPQERDEINEQVYGAVPHHVAFHAAIEAKLKEKNT